MTAVRDSVGATAQASLPATSSPVPAPIAWRCALIAVALAFFTICMAQQGIPRPTALIKMSRSEPMAELTRKTDPGFVFVDPEEHYDGVYYYTIARDPLLLGEEHNRIDQAAYRYGHPMYGWAAHLLSFGQDASIPFALMLLSLAGIGTAAWGVSRLAVIFGRSPWAGLLVPAIPGMLYATTISTTETFAAGLMALSLILWFRDRLLLAGLAMLMLSLTKEQYITVPAGLGLWELVEVYRTRRFPRDLRWRMAALVIGPLVLALWYVYVHAQFDRWPMQYESGNLGWPLLGWFDTFSRAYALSGGSFDQSEIGTTATPVLIALGFVMVMSFTKALRFRTPLDGIVLGMVAIVACSGWQTLLYPHEMVRTHSAIFLFCLAALLAGPFLREQRTLIPAAEDSSAV